MELPQDIKSIIEAGQQAPSGANLQHWKFLVREGEIHLFWRWVDTKPLYDFRNRGSLISHGAVIENIVIAASHFGYETEVSLFPENNDPDYVAIIKLIKTEVKKDYLYPFIAKRVTNRKDYYGIPLTKEEKDCLLGACRNTNLAVHLTFVDEPKRKRKLAGLLSISERLIFENKFVHNSVYSFFRWTKKEISQKDGLNVATLEYSFPLLCLMRLLQSWQWLLLFKFFGVSLLATRTVTRTNNSSGAICALTIVGESREEFIESGRVLERIWLEATRLGLSVYPIEGFILLGQRVESGDTGLFTPFEDKLILRSFQQIEDIFNASDKTIAIVFRIGKADPPSARSLRKAPEIIGREPIPK